MYKVLPILVEYGILIVFSCRSCRVQSLYVDLLFLCSCESVEKKRKRVFYAIKWRQKLSNWNHDGRQNWQMRISQSVSWLAEKTGSWTDWQTDRQRSWQADKQLNLAFNAKEKRNRNTNYNSEVLEVADRPDRQTCHTLILIWYAICVEGTLPLFKQTH